jgi:ABC-2 type transport system permease protein
MNAATETTEGLSAPARAPAPTRPFYWSVRRELWESRSLYIAPLVAAGVIVLSFIFNAIHLQEGIKQLAALDPARQRTLISAVYFGVAMLITFTTLLVSFFYSLDALHGERRDRSILFWKSMPVSDLTVVLTKMFTALVVAPAIAFVVIIATQLLLLLLSTVIVLFGGASPAPIWSNLQMFQLTVGLLYTFVALALWYAPICAWLLLVSAWAKRSTFLWAILPPIAVIVFERVAFGSNHFREMLGYRLKHGLRTAFDSSMQHGVIVDGQSIETGRHLPQNVLLVLDPVQFFSNPWLWVGLAVAAALIAATVWMRRYREPI